MKFIIPVALTVFLFPTMTFAGVVCADLPRGTYSDKCKNCEISDDCFITCEKCQKTDKTWNHKVTPFDSTQCKDIPPPKGYEIAICNFDGQLLCGGVIC